MHTLDRIPNSLGIIIFEQITSRSIANGIQYVFIVIKCSQDQRARLRPLCQLTCSLNPIHVGHSDIQQRNIYIMSLAVVNGLLTISDGGNYFKITERSQYNPHALPDERIIVRNQHLDLHHESTPLWDYFT
ncbi:hypothetical protein D3C81_824970 [compost metagenome]